MLDNHKLTLYVAYYLSRFDKLGLKNLGYSSWSDAFTEISKRLDVNIHSVKNWRDEFDPIHGFRAGWHKRPMSPSRVQVVNALENLEEEEIRFFIKNIISGHINEEPNNLNELLKVISGGEISTKNIPTSRKVTGRKAEEVFISHYESGRLPLQGKIKDTRDLDTGCDFEILSENITYFFEVKGISKSSGGILLTDKEWKKAKNHGKHYYLFLVSNLSEEPSVLIINDPFSKLKPKMNLVSTIQIQWSFSEKEVFQS